MTRVNRIVVGVVALVAAFELGRFVEAPAVKAQSSSPSYVCTVGQSGTTSAFPCAQYLVTIAPQRLGGGTFIYQLENPLDVSDPAVGAVLVVNGPVNATTSVQVFQPGSDMKTSTVEVTVP